MKKNYIIRMVPRGIAEKWSKNKEEVYNIRLKINKKTGEIKAELKLGLIEALCFKRAIKKYNKLHNGQMIIKQGEKHKAERYRV